MGPNKAIAAAIAVFAAQTASAKPVDIQPKIVGGSQANQAEWRSIVSIRFDHGFGFGGIRHICGGTLVSADTIVTAAHCHAGKPVSRLSVLAGSNDRKSRQATVVGVARIINHPDYRPDSSLHDVSVWKLSRPIPESNTIEYARMPRQREDPPPSAAVKVAGWGAIREIKQPQGTQGPQVPIDEETIAPQLLREARLQVVDRSTCSQAYAPTTQVQPGPVQPGPIQPGQFGKRQVAAQITENMICAGASRGAQDSCYGDSGGPLVNADSNTLVGIVSFGLECGHPTAPGIYTKVSSYLDWIRQVAGNIGGNGDNGNGNGDNGSGNGDNGNGNGDDGGVIQVPPMNFDSCLDLLLQTWLSSGNGVLTQVPPNYDNCIKLIFDVQLPF